MYYTGIFDDLNYMTLEEYKAGGTWRVYEEPLEFMDYVIKGMKRFLQSPFQQ